ncbi:hypothetical protein [Saccharopolyspora rosea]|uniref:Uncharacterized protein n=1 Tax=Saccharopolyspora rosea TaxID=524884 RepID=A0ABW3FLJ0_9PSEU|nr:hypothetical protein [Saccharopolyspora rosea]
MSWLPSELHGLRDLFQNCDPVPEHVLDAAYSAVGRRWDVSDQAVLELVGDSAEATTTVRSAAGPEPRVLTFLMPGRILEMDLVPTVQGMCRASGMVVNRAGHTPPTGDVVLRHSAGHSAGELDAHGAFRVEDVPRGPLSVVYRPLRSAPAIADWLVC